MQNKLINKIFIFLFITSVITLGGLGCKGLSKEQEAAITPITLDYWTVFDDVDQLRTLAEEYKSIRPYVTINIRQVRYDEFDRLFANALADDVGPDIVSIHSRWLNKYKSRLDSMPASVNVYNVYTKGKYQPETIVEPLVNQMMLKNDVRRLFVSAVADDVIINDEIYGLPLAIDTLALYYNKELLDKSGVPVAPSTWVEFSDAVKKGTHFNSDGEIIQSGVALGTGNNIDNSFDILSLLMMQNGIEIERGGRISFADGLSARGNENHPMLQAMRFYTDFARPTKDVYSWNEKQANALENFAQGKSVFYLGFAYDRPRIRARGPQLKIETIPIPQLNSAAPSNMANYWVESVVDKSANKNEAWDFIRFISSPDNISRYVEATGQPSPLRAQIAEQQEDPELEAFALQALTAKNWYHGKDIDAAENAFNSLINDYLQPYGERESPLERDAGLIIRTAQIVQQTL